MLARLTRRLLWLQLVCVALIAIGATCWLHFTWPTALLTASLALVLLRMAVTANSFTMAWRYHSKTPPEHRLGILQMPTLFFMEFYASMWSSSWGMPFKTFTGSDITTSDTAAVLLIHGYGCNSGYWHGMRKVLRQAEVAHRAVDLEPLFADIEDYVPAIHQAVENLCRDSGRDEIIIVAHSMGGLAARAYVRVHGLKRVARLITLGTPHHGTGIANFGAGMNCRQMHWRGNAANGAPSAWLRKLDASEDAPMRARVVSIYSHHDNIVSPQISAHLDGAHNIAYHGIGHVSLALHPQIQARVLDEIRLATPA